MNDPRLIDRVSSVLPLNDPVVKWRFGLSFAVVVKFEQAEPKQPAELPVNRIAASAGAAAKPNASAAAPINDANFIKLPLAKIKNDTGNIVQI